VAANEAGITRDGSIVLKSGDAKELLPLLVNKKLRLRSYAS